VVIGYVIMPEHIHLLLSEPEVGTISTVMQVLKQRTARALLPKVKPDPLCATHPSQKAREGRATRPGGPTAVYVAGTTGPLYYRHADWLGSSRLASTQSRTKYFDVSYAPFGEDYNDLGTTDYNFTGQNQDTETGYYDFLFREYSPVQGRWLSPDPAGTAAADPTNPQSWNRYVYVLNNPLALVDPLGLDCVYLTDDGGHVQEIDHEAINDGECAASGGYWIEGSVNDPSWVTIDSDAGTVSGYGVTWDGFFEFSVAGAMGTNPFGAWTQTFSLGETVNVIGTVDPVDTQASALAAPSNAGPSRWSCAWSAVKTEGISFGTDALGAIPGEGQGLAIAQLTAGGIGFVNSLYHRDAGGAVGAVVGDQTVLVGIAARQMGVDALKAVPVAGNLLSAGLAVRDVVHGVQDYNGCMGGH
jgi:RHS repeat-associated protein